MIKHFILLVMLFVSTVAASRELSHYVAERLQQANQLAQDDNLKKAIDILRKTEASFDYDKAFIARMLGVFYWQNGQTQQAIEQLKYAVSSEQLKDDQAWVSERMLADLYLNERAFKQALKHYYKLIKVVPLAQLKPDVWLRVAQSHYQLEQWEDVIVTIDRYLDTDIKDRRQALTIKLGAQLALKRSHDAIDTLALLIEIEPDKLQWWRQLSVLQMQLGQQRQALSTLSLAKLNGLPLSESDRHLLAQMYARQGIPERAAIEISQLEGAQTSSQLLAEQASYWQTAKQWDLAMSVWNKAAQQDPKYNWNLAKLLVQQGLYDESIPILDRVKGREMDVALVKCLAFYKLNQLDNALLEAKQADQIEPSNQAKRWITFLSELIASSRKTTAV